MTKSEFIKRFTDAVTNATFDLYGKHTKTEVVFGLGYQTGGECIAKMGELKGRMACKGKLCPLVYVWRDDNNQKWKLAFASIFTSFGERQWLDHKYLTRSRRRTHSLITRPIPAYVEYYFLADSSEAAQPYREDALAWLRSFYATMAATLPNPEWAAAAQREVDRIDQDAANYAEIGRRQLVAV